jgi:hypothetical protein
MFINVGFGHWLPFLSILAKHVQINARTHQKSRPQIPFELKKTIKYEFEEGFL